MENDWLDAIVQLSTDQFMNTGISTYIWVLCKDKPAYRCGKVQLIDASHCYEQRRKAIGTKRNDISDHCRELKVFSVCGHSCGQNRFCAAFGNRRNPANACVQGFAAFRLARPGYRHGTPKPSALPTALIPDIFFSIPQLRVEGEESFAGLHK